MKSDFYSKDELDEIGFESVGEHVLVSRKASIYRADAISLGNHVRIDDFCILSGGKGIKIGNYVHVGAYSALYGGDRILMEDFSGLSPRCTLHSESDDAFGYSLWSPMVPLKYKPRYKSAPIVFRQHAGTGAGTVVLPGVELAEGAVVGALSMVNQNCESWSIFSGVPAKRIMRRSRKLLGQKERFLADLNF